MKSLGISSATSRIAPDLLKAMPIMKACDWMRKLETILEIREMASFLLQLINNYIIYSFHIIRLDSTHSQGGVSKSLHNLVNAYFVTNTLIVSFVLPLINYEWNWKFTQKSKMTQSFLWFAIMLTLLLLKIDKDIASLKIVIAFCGRYLLVPNW